MQKRDYTLKLQRRSKSALWSIKGEKCPDPNGYNSNFFMRTWKIVGSDIVQAIKDYFRNGTILQQVNSIAIPLISKVASPRSLNVYKPIS